MPFTDPKMQGLGPFPISVEKALPPAKSM